MTVILRAAKNLYLRDFYIHLAGKILRSAQDDSWVKMVFEVTIYFFLSLFAAIVYGSCQSSRTSCMGEADPDSERRNQSHGTSVQRYSMVTSMSTDLPFRSSRSIVFTGYSV